MIDCYHRNSEGCYNYKSSQKYVFVCLCLKYLLNLMLDKNLSDAITSINSCGYFDEKEESDESDEPAEEQEGVTEEAKDTEESQEISVDPVVEEVLQPTVEDTQQTEVIISQSKFVKISIAFINSENSWLNFSLSLKFMHLILNSMFSDASLFWPFKSFLG